MKRVAAPELIWPGKYDEHGRRVPVPRRHPRLVVDERHPGLGTRRRAAKSLLVLADNLLCLDALADTHAGQIDLIYVDPPFMTGTQFDVATRVGHGDGKSIPELRARAYGDAWQGGLTGFLAMLDPRLRLVHELLAPHGSLYVHVDPIVGHAVKLVLDEVFGPGCFQREIVWRIGWVSGFKTQTRNWIRNHDLIFFYVKDPKRFTFNKPLVPYPDGYRRRDGALPKGKGIPIDDVWNAGASELSLTGSESLDSIQIKSFSSEKTGYATQKNESLVRRIIAASSRPGDLIADVFAGSGTTLVAAEKLGRRFIGCDTALSGVHIARKRLLELDSRAPFEICRVVGERTLWLEGLAEAGEGTDAAHRRVVLGHHGAGPVNRVGAAHGRRGRAPVIVVEPGRRGTVADLHAAGNGAHVLSWAWDCPADAGDGVVQLRIGRGIMDPRCAAERDAAVWPCARVGIDLEGLARGNVTVRLSDYAFDHPRLLPRAAREAVNGWSDWIDWWAVDWNGRGRVFTARAFAQRTHGRRDLTLELGPHRYGRKGPFELRVRTMDVLGQPGEQRITLVRRGKGLAISRRRCG